VGGDWYDIIPLAAGRVGMAIGDVEGRGARAAATMGQLRAALRAFAQDEKAPADILRKLDEWVRSEAPADVGDPPTVSCIFMVYDAWSRELTFAVAGHAAPLLAVGGSVEPVEVRHKGVLLGVRGRGIRGLPTYTEQTMVVPPGASIVLYTDGLTDRRSRVDGPGHYSEAEALAMLQEAVSAANLAPGAPPGLFGHADGDSGAARVASAAEHAVPGDIDDDMAILVFRSSERDLASSERVFPAEPVMVSEARRVAAQTFAAWGMDPDQAELACLLVSEVVTNAVLHASLSAQLSRRFGTDADQPPPAPAVPAGSAGTGPGGPAPPAAMPLPLAAPVAVPAVSVPPRGAARPRGASAAGSPDGTGRDDWEPDRRDPLAQRRPSEFILRLRRGAAAIWVEVFDPDLRLPRLRSAGATDEGGRGLYLVEQLATRWGSRPTPEGKAVWFEMPLSG
jgi:anti-sigma regulatory factor (Ser/Thr protein kinase)